MSYQTERGKFIEAMRAESMPYGYALAILRDAQVIQTCAEAECNDESADRDRVPCPKESQKNPSVDCLCRQYGSNQTDRDHGKIPRVSARSWRAERRIERLLASLDTPGFVADFQGDPRGACVKIKVPSGRTDDWGRTSMCVPTRG